MKLLILAALVGLSVADTCIHCICLHESGCKPIGCDEDEGSLSCGYYQIKWPYYEDCGKPGGATEDDWKTCSDDYACSTKCVQSYVARYAGECPGVGDCQRMSRLHNGGPRGCQNSNTVGYWQAIQKCCGCS